MANSRFILLNTLPSHYFERNCSTAWRPSADIFNAGEEWLIKVELAGVKQEDIHLNVHHRRLNLAGRRRDLVVLQNHSPYSLEIAYNRFERVFSFATAIDSTTVRSEYRDGMLYIYLRTRSEA